MALPKGVHRVKRRLASDAVRWHFYAWRGGPKYWEDDRKEPTDPDFSRAYADAVKRPKPGKLTVPALVDAFLDSAAMPKGERSRADLRKWALRFAAEF